MYSFESLFHEYQVVSFDDLLLGYDSGGGSTTVAAVHDGYVLQKVLCIVVNNAAYELRLLVSE